MGLWARAMPLEKYLKCNVEISDFGIGRLKNIALSL